MTSPDLWQPGASIHPECTQTLPPQSPTKHGVGDSHLSLQSPLRLAVSAPVLPGGSPDRKPVLVVLTVLPSNGLHCLCWAMLTKARPKANGRLHRV